MRILGDEALAVELLTIYYLLVFVQLQHGKAGQVTPATHEAMLFPFPCVYALEAGHIGRSIDKELLTLWMIHTKEARDRQHTPLFRSGRPSDRIRIELTHGHRYEAIFTNLITFLCHILRILCDILNNIIGDTLNDIGHGCYAAVDRLESCTLDITLAVIAVGSGILCTIHVVPETTQDIIHYKLSWFAIIQVEHELAGVISVIGADNLLDTSLTGRVPAGA